MLIAKLNACFGVFGKTCALRKFSFLCLSLLIALILSWPTVQRLRDSLYTASIMAEAHNDQFWQYTPHVQPGSKQPSDDMFAVYQIRITNPNNNEPVTHDLLTRARDWQLGLMTFQVKDLNGQSVSLSELPFFKLYSPFGTLWQYDEIIHDDWSLTLNNNNNQQYHDNNNNNNTSSSTFDPLSVFDNATLDQHGKLISADAIVLTAVLLRNNDEYVWKKVMEHFNKHMGSSWYIKQANAPALSWQYKFKILFPDYDIPIGVYAFLLSHIVIFFIVSSTFGTTQFVKSRYGLGLAAVFTSITCVTVTLSILDRFGVQLDAVPWYLYPLVSNVATLENSFLLTNAVVNAGCDMQVKEKVSRGLQSVGVPMIGTLIAELVILEIGRYMEAPMIKQFCLFAQVALVIEYCLEMTFFMAILSIDINRAELADLDDRQVSKRLRELAISGADAEQQQSPDFCPIQDSSEQTSCAECKDFKTHREVNALMLCMVILGLMMFQSYFGRVVSFCPPSSSHVFDLQQQELITKTERLRTVSTEYWNMINPTRETRWIRVEPPYLATYGIPTTASTFHSFESAYRDKALGIQTVQSKRQPPSRLRSFMFTCARNTFLFVSNISIPSLILCIVLIGILIWLTPGCREQWIIPLSKKVLLRIMNPNTSNGIICWFRGHFLQQYQETVHVGAISAQEQYQKRNSSAGNVSIKTLRGQHVADIRRFDVNAKHGIVISCGQDDRVVAWDTRKARPISQLSYDGVGNDNGGTISNNKSISAKCVKIDQGNKWIAAALNNGTVWVWSVCTGKVAREFTIERDYADIQQPQQQVVFRNRRHNDNSIHGDINSKKKRHLDRVLAVQFIGAVAEYCHPKVAEVAAKTNGRSTVESQNYLVTAHKSGMIREWDIISGECMQTVPSGHTRDISILHVVEAKAPHRKLGVSWVFTASKDGRVTCWERQIVKQQDTTSVWACAYSIKGHQGHPITSIATELPVGGMGILVTAASDRSVRVWNFETGEPVCILSDPSSSTTTKSTGDNASLATISQVAATRYCEVEKGRGMCRGCDTCFGNGFFIATSSTDGIVDTYRLERVGSNGHSGSCQLCSKDYNRSQYKRKKKPLESTTISSNKENSNNTQLAASSSSSNRPPRRQRHHQSRNISKPSSNNASGDDLLKLLDIEQLAGDNEEIKLVPTRLGKIDQPAGRGLAFCGKSRLLAGVRQKTGGHQWEAWFTSLQYIDPEKNDDNDQNHRIPVETFDLDQDNEESEEEVDSYFGLFGVDPQDKTTSRRKEQQEQTDEDYELLPFSTVHHVLPLDGTGLACDFGNFIKLIYLEDEHRKKHIPSCQCDACLKTKASQIRCSIIPNCPQASECLSARQQAL
ncbi:sterol-sensing domain of SREBP cleavage-activation-domain-containing protein [Circinella umbellata]|nr:sterol-sensing domain of SREBP cleavage-activation-domain-containing protein [Circinella umbellata]